MSNNNRGYFPLRRCNNNENNSDIEVSDDSKSVLSENAELEWTNGENNEQFIPIHTYGAPNFRKDSDRLHEPYCVTFTKEKTIEHKDKPPYTVKTSPVDVYFDIIPLDDEKRQKQEKCIKISCNVKDANGNSIGDVYIDNINKKDFFKNREYREDKVKQLQLKVFAKILNTKTTCKIFSLKNTQDAREGHI